MKVQLLCNDVRDGQYLDTQDSLKVLVMPKITEPMLVSDEAVPMLDHFPFENWKIHRRGVGYVAVSPDLEMKLKAAGLMP